MATEEQSGAAAVPAYGRPGVWAAGKMGHTTHGPHDPSGESHNRAHPQAARYVPPADATPEEEGRR